MDGVVEKSDKEQFMDVSTKDKKKCIGMSLSNLTSGTSLLCLEIVLYGFFYSGRKYERFFG